VNNTTAYAFVDSQWGVRRTYASPEDFCAIFQEEMSALYSLALLLTGGDRQAAETCFLAALDDCRQGSDVFPEWARSWSRRAIVRQAIRQICPQPDEAASAIEAAHEADDIPRRLLQLRPFQRFVFGLTVLERYSARECATLLGCHALDVERARIGALQFLGGSSRDSLTVPFAGAGRQEPKAIANISGNI
jgi:DNA-directed RNA polymerase specialized sigma24 family protein